MTIEKGAPWGSAGCVPVDAAVASSDHDLATSSGVCVLTGGNLHTAIGSPAAKTPGSDCALLPVDAIIVDIEAPDGTRRTVTAAADVIIGSWYGRHGFLLVTNTGHLGGLHLTPRSHPNDGRLDTLVMQPDMRWRERIVARRRARTGTHVPHPKLATGHVRTLTVARRGRQRLHIDGRNEGHWRSVTVTVSPDRWLVAV